MGLRSVALVSTLLFDQRLLESDSPWLRGENYFRSAVRMDSWIQRGEQSGLTAAYLVRTRQRTWTFDLERAGASPLIVVFLPLVIGASVPPSWRTDHGPLGVLGEPHKRIGPLVAGRRNCTSASRPVCLVCLSGHVPETPNRHPQTSGCGTLGRDLISQACSRASPIAPPRVSFPSA